MKVFDPVKGDHVHPRTFRKRKHDEPGAYAKLRGKSSGAVHLPGSGGGTSGAAMGSGPRSGIAADEAGDQGIPRIAKDLAAAETIRRKRGRPRKDTSATTRIEVDRDAFLRPEPGTVSEPTAESPEPQSEPQPEHFETRVAGEAARRPYNRKPKIDLEQKALLQQSLTLILNGLGSTFTGSTIEIRPEQSAMTVEPVTRMIERMQPDTVKVLTVLSDPIVAVLGFSMLVSEWMAIRRDNENRGRGYRPPPPTPPPPTGEENTQPFKDLANDNHNENASPVAQPSSSIYDPNTGMI